MKNIKNSYLYIIAVFLIFADQITKLSVKGFDFLGIQHQGFYYGEQVPVIGTVLQWTFIENPGMAFGIEFGWAKIFLSLFSILASCVLIYIINKINTSHIAIRTGFTLIFAGAVGNLIDRVFYGVIFGEQPLFYGKVVDFIQVDIPDIALLGWTHFPVFNIADSCVTVGVSFLILFNSKLPNFDVIFSSKSKQNNLNEIENLTNIEAKE